MALNSNKPSHLKALLKKNWILWKRSWCISLLEIAVPLLFAILMIALRQASSLTDVPTITYYDLPQTSFTYDGILNPDYFKDCNADENGGIVAIVPDPSTDSLAFDVDQALRNSLLKFTLIFLGNAGFTTRSFNSNAEIDDYTSQSGYTTLARTGQTLCFAVVINQNGVNNQYEYMLRFNVSSYDEPDLPDTADKRVNNIAL